MRFDLVVVGAGHAGTEAAAVAARLGLHVALVALDPSAVGRLSCNPAVGGQGKGHLVREIDALGGLMARVADATTLHFRHLNTRKGLAVRASRAQVDVDRYPKAMVEALSRIPRLQILPGEVTALDLRDGRVAGVVLADGTRLAAPRVILTTGTFLSAVMFRGQERTAGGRVGERSSERLAEQIRELGLGSARFKTGTVPRLRADSIHWDETEAQADDLADARLSFGPPAVRPGSITCHLVHTVAACHDTIRAHLSESPLFGGAITGIGPRYCPSIEDKVHRFADKERHLLFLEPEGLDTDAVYVNGLSTSLPRAAQDAVVRAIPALRDAVILRYGYAVEYDVIDPTSLDHGLGCRALPGLYLAGQVNGTSGYEEAAAQGLIAGLSAAQDAPFRVGRHEGYLGVLIDDLVGRGPGGEPYRMFTSRAEHRLVLREDNADRRLMPRGREMGLIDDATWERFQTRQTARDAALHAASALALNAIDAPAALEAGIGPVHGPMTGADVLRRPGVGWDDLRRFDPSLPVLSDDLAEEVVHDFRYAGYIHAAERRAQAAAARGNVAIPADLDLSALPSLAAEVRQRLTRARPATLDDLGSWPGITPGALDVIAAAVARHLGRVPRGTPPRPQAN